MRLTKSYHWGSTSGQPYKTEAAALKAGARWGLEQFSVEFIPEHNLEESRKTPLYNAMNEGWWVVDEKNGERMAEKLAALLSELGHASSASWLLYKLSEDGKTALHADTGLPVEPKTNKGTE